MKIPTNSIFIKKRSSRSRGDKKEKRKKLAKEK
jgi:hypothetical protein